MGLFCIMEKLSGIIWDIKRYALHDGPGIRSTVFFKGCPLSCLWCCNPESQSFSPELLWLQELCAGCGTCANVCPRDAVEIHQHGESRAPAINRATCDMCGECVSQCPAGALSIAGERVTVDDVLHRVAQDSVFFARTGGGLTLSGGEPLAQPGFAAEILRRYVTEEGGRSTAVETCGHARWEHLAALAPYVSVFLYDIKHMNDAAHTEMTGKGNSLILENARRLTKQGATMVIRIPLAPGLNDDDKNIELTAAFARDIGARRVDLLPYHRLGEGKYSRIGRTYSLQGASSQSPERVQELARRIQAMGLEVRVGG